MTNIYVAITAYADAQDAITRAVRNCLTKPKELAKLIGISTSQFYERIRRKNWSPNEMLMLANLLPEQRQLSTGGPEAQ